MEMQHSYLWEQSSDNISWTSVGTSSSYSATGTLAMNGYYYRVTATSCGSTTYPTVRLYVNASTASITGQNILVEDSNYNQTCINVNNSGSQVIYGAVINTDKQIDIVPQDGGCA